VSCQGYDGSPVGVRPKSKDDVARHVPSLPLAPQSLSAAGAPFYRTERFPEQAGSGRARERLR
jgi:hypothetical protein